MEIILLASEKLDLELKHKRERDGRVRDRIKAVLLSHERWTQLQIAQALRIHPETVHEHLEAFKVSRQLKPMNGGSISVLSTDDISNLILHLEEKTYVYVRDICTYVLQTFHVLFTVSGMTKWLHRNKFSYKMPKETPAKADPIKQAEFIRKYEALLNATSGEPVVFIDSVHPTMATKVTHGWIRTGAEKPIATTGSRTRINVTGSINLETMELHTKAYETINGATTIDFLKSLEIAYPKALKIHVILDQSGYHRCADVVNFSKKSRIELHFLPPYSPNLNPIERVWKVMNEYVRNNRFFHSAKEFRTSILDFFSMTWPTISHSMVDRITDNFQILKSASSS